jgi:Tfp pilus assembly major pilin PilA
MIIIFAEFVEIIHLNVIIVVIIKLKFYQKKFARKNVVTIHFY